MYISVIPLTHSLSTRPLTYSVGDIFDVDSLTVGELISIPLGKLSTLGIIAHLDVASLGEDQEVRSILSRESQTPLLAPYQIGMIESIAEMYMLPIHRVVQWFLPRPVQVRLQKRGYPVAQVYHEPRDTPPKKSLAISQNSIINHSIIARFLQDTPQVIIAPDDFTLFELEQHFADAETLFVFQEMTDTRRAQAWIDIRAGKYKRIFGTRRILYYNLQAYREILYLEDAFQTEYFHFPLSIEYTRVLAFFDQHTDFDIQILTSGPLLKTLSLFRHFPLNSLS